MAVAFDAKATTITVQASNTSPVTNTTLTVGASATLLIGVFSSSNNTSGGAATAMTWNGVTMTAVGNIASADGTGNVYVFAIVNPATGAHTLSCTFTATSGGAPAVYIDCYTFKGTETSSVAAAITGFTTNQSSPTGTVYPASAFSLSTTNGDAVSALHSSAISYSQLYNAAVSTSVILNNDAPQQDYAALYNLSTGTTTTAQFSGTSGTGQYCGCAFVIHQPASAAPNWGFDQQGMISPNTWARTRQVRASAFANADDASGEEVFTTNWRNVGFEVQPVQPPHPRREKFGSLVIGDPGNELPEILWYNVGSEVQPVQPPHPRREKFATLIGGDPGNEFTEIQWYNTGSEVQSFQPPNPATTNKSRGNRLAASSFARGDDGVEFPQIQWYNTGGEVQPFQPPTNIPLNNRRAATLAQGDSGFYQTTSPPAVINWGFDPQPVQPPRFRLQRWASIVNGDDASGDETSTSNWVNVGYEQQSVQPPKLRLQRWAALVNGDDASGEDSPLVNWYNSGFEVQNVQPPRFRLQRWAANVNGDDATSEENPLINWPNVGWEIQPHQPQHPRPEKSGAIAPSSNVVNVFIPPPAAPTLIESVIPTLKIRWSNRAEAIFGDVQFLFQDMQPWQEPQSVQPPHPRREKFGAQIGGDTGNELPLVRWFNSGSEIQSPQPPHPRRERAGAIQRGDDGIENILPQVAVVYAWGFDPQPFQPPNYPSTRQRYGAIKGGSEFGSLPNFYPWGFEVQWVQPPHPRSEKSGALARSDDGTENVYQFVATTIVRWGFDGVYPQPPHPRPERSGAIARGDDGIENTYQFVAPTVVNWSFDPQPIQPPRARWERRYGSLKHRSEFAILPNWVNSGWYPVVPQPPHPRPERSGSIARGDDGTENPFQFVPPPQVINWGFEVQSVQPPRPMVRQRYTAIKGRTHFAIFPTYVTWQWEVQHVQPPHRRVPERGQAIFGVSEFAFSDLKPVGFECVWPQPPHPRPEKSGGIMPIETGIEARYVFVPPTIVLWGYDGVCPQPPHPRPNRAGAISPWQDEFFLTVTRVNVFFAKSVITAGTGKTVVSKGKSQTVVRGEPA